MVTLPALAAPEALEASPEEAEDLVEVGLLSAAQAPLERGVRYVSMPTHKGVVEDG